MTLAAKIADFAETAPEGMKDYRIHPELAALAADLRTGRVGLKETAVRAWVMNDRLDGTANEMDRARLRCIAKRIARRVLS